MSNVRYSKEEISALSDRPGRTSKNSSSVRGRGLTHTDYTWGISSMPDPRSAATSCVCCAVIFHKHPGNDCRSVPMWELENWECPDCNPPVQKSSLCGRVVYNFRTAISTSLKPARSRIYDLGADSYTYRHVLEGGSYGLLMGYYRDTACSVTASPSVGLDNDYIGHLNGGDAAIYDLQLYPFPRSPPPAYKPGNCCNQYSMLCSTVALM